MKTKLKNRILLIVVLMYGFNTCVFSSKIVFYRESNFYGSALTYKVYNGDEMIGKLRNNSYFEYSCEPGTYNFKINKLNNTNLRLEVEESQTYYLRLSIRTGMWSSIPELILVDSISAYPAIASGEMNNINSEIPMERAKNRIGIDFNMGGGISNIGMITTTDNEESTISFGGGFGVGIKYGYQFSRHFDLSSQIYFQESSLRPYLKNAEIAFWRNAISITPALVLPIGDGYLMKFRIGAGFDKYWGAKMRLETSEIPDGFDDTWKYNSNIGYHVVINYELNPSEKWIINYGIRYYSVNYEFDSGETTFPISNELKTGNGSGIDFTLGLYFNF